MLFESFEGGVEGEGPDYGAALSELDVLGGAEGAAGREADVRGADGVFVSDRDFAVLGGVDPYCGVLAEGGGIGGYCLHDRVIGVVKDSRLVLVIGWRVELGRVVLVLEFVVEFVLLLFQLQVSLNQLSVFGDQVRVLYPHVHEIFLQFQRLGALFSQLVLQGFNLLLEIMNAGQKTLSVVLFLDLELLVHCIPAVHRVVPWRVRGEYRESTGQRVVDICVSSLRNLSLCLCHLQIPQYFQVLVFEFSELPVAPLHSLAVLDGQLLDRGLEGGVGLLLSLYLPHFLLNLLVQMADLLPQSLCLLTP